MALELHSAMLQRLIAHEPRRRRYGMKAEQFEQHCGTVPLMGWRKTGVLQAPEEILVMTCDVCERDIGYEDGRRPKPHYEIRRLPNQGTMGDQAPAVFVCSPECLRAFASQASSDPKGLPSRGGTAPPA